MQGQVQMQVCPAGAIRQARAGQAGVCIHAALADADTGPTRTKAGADTAQANVQTIRQTGMAIGVAALVAMVGTASTPTEKLAAFSPAWWPMAAVIALGLLPCLFIQRK